MGDLETDDVKLIVNNILCYISTARLSMRVDDIVKSCFAFYHIDDIVKGKDLFYDIVGERPIRRRNENNILHELQDITDLFNKCDEENNNSQPLLRTHLMLYHLRLALRWLLTTWLNLMKRY